jgi:Ca2+-binding RTX toxin-like protein
MAGGYTTVTGHEFNDIIADGDYIPREDTRRHVIWDEQHFVVIRYQLFDKSGAYVGTVDVVEREGVPPPGTTITVLGAQTVDGQDSMQIGQVGLININDKDGNLVGSIGGIQTLGRDAIVAGLAESVPSDQRYANWVSLFNGDMTITGHKGDDRGLEVGAGGTATVTSGKGDDLVRVWHDKNVVFNGGKGVDTISFTPNAGSAPAATTGATVNLTTGTGTNPFGGTITLSKVENASGVFDKANTLIGNGKDNQLISGWQADTIKGEGGDDTIIVASTFDTTPRAMNIDGGAGNDLMMVGLSYTDFIGGVYVNTLDLLNAANNTGTFRGGAFTGIETFRATGDNLTMFDFRGSNSGEAAIGLGGADHLQGRGGNDTLRGAFGADTIDGGDGRDVADYSDNNFAKIVAKINGASTTITVGGVQQDVLISIEGAKGGNANDKLTGDNGANELDGSLGKDKLIGKGGKDHFVFSTELSPGNVDTIKDFAHGTDKIDLDEAIFAALGPKVTSGEFLKVSSGHAAKQKDDHLIYNKTDGTLWYDDDGSGKHAALKFAVLTGSPDNLSASDFHIV